MKVKICGLQNMESAQYAVKQGVDAIGFVFAKSKREISLNSAKSIISQLPKGINKVGVFVNPSREMIDEVVSKTGINVIQLHGDETPEFCATLPYPVIKAFSIESVKDLERIHHYSCEYVLLDGPKGKYHGGNGISFDWGLLTSFDFKNKKVILAGGLNSENVRSAIHLKNIDMVDVSSGVETNGEKDLGKIKKFIATVKSTELIL
ncbi:phosphoribosylanthranilate isomerase [Niallia sp. Krafla_26]|uniref:phosphoribosylanthranilate isomerase n=1 Tax=Niallia sp. Krafla_26 TaxID=3064703 RepID=UPI003D177E79